MCVYRHNLNLVVDASYTRTLTNQKKTHSVTVTDYKFVRNMQGA
jgi:hypothetical protein